MSTNTDSQRLTHDGFKYIQKMSTPRVFFITASTIAEEDTTSLMEPSDFLHEGDHTRQCCMIYGHDPYYEYHCNGKTTNDQNEYHGTKAAEYLLFKEHTQANENA